jgi:hypothetical protein
VVLLRPRSNICVICFVIINHWAILAIDPYCSMHIVPLDLKGSFTEVKSSFPAARNFKRISLHVGEPSHSKDMRPAFVFQQKKIRWFITFRVRSPRCQEQRSDTGYEGAGIHFLCFHPLQCARSCRYMESYSSFLVWRPSSSRM